MSFNNFKSPSLAASRKSIDKFLDKGMFLTAFSKSSGFSLINSSSFQLANSTLLNLSFTFVLSCFSSFSVFSWNICSSLGRKLRVWVMTSSALIRLLAVRFLLMMLGGFLRNSMAWQRSSYESLNFCFWSLSCCLETDWVHRLGGLK